MNDQQLDEAIQRRAAQDPVAVKKKELAPVVIAAKKAKQEFETLAASLRPRMEAARIRTGKLEQLRGSVLGEARRLWTELENTLTGGPNSFQGIVTIIDELTAYKLAQPYEQIHCVAAMLQSALANTGALERHVHTLERELDRQDGNATAEDRTPVLLTKDSPPRRGPAVESTFDV